MLEFEVEAHVVHLLEDVVVVGASLDGQVAASTDGKPGGLSVASASHEVMLRAKDRVRAQAAVTYRDPFVVSAVVVVGGLRLTSDVLRASDGLSAKSLAGAEHLDSKDPSLSVEVDRDRRVVHGDVSNAAPRHLSAIDFLNQIDVGSVRFGVVSHSHTHMVAGRVHSSAAPGSIRASSEGLNPGGSGRRKDPHRAKCCTKPVA
jgi:hypothetical protein